jgi:hypothetical protein
LLKKLARWLRDTAKPKSNEMGMQRGVELARRVEVRYKLNELGNLFIEHALEVDIEK